MKIKPEHFEKLKTDCLQVMHDNPDAKEEYKVAGLSEKRFRWDLLYAAKLSPWICDNLYSYLNDEHIDTALRKIVN